MPRSARQPRQYMKFCSRCRAINWERLAERLDIEASVPLYNQPTAMRDFDSAECDVCRQIRQSIKSQGVTHTPDSPVAVYWSGRRHDFRLQVLLDPSEGIFSRLGSYLFRWTGESRGQGLTSIASITKIWLDDCSEMHQFCRRPDEENGGEKPRLPSRVIDVGQDHESAPKLLLTYGLRARYATLSYSWGEGHRFTVTQSNAEQLSRSIQVASLPKLFQDAIELTRRTGIQFLWIDALCIIQDLPSEVERELQGLMPIYTNSTITFAAVGQSSVRDALICLDEVEDHSSRNRQFDLDAHMHHISTGHPGTLQLPLHTRAWCLQETLLSRRILALGQREVFWYCRSYQRRSTDFKAKIIRRPEDYEAEIYGPLVDEKIVSEDLAQRPFNFWYNTIAKYSKRKLSFQDDRLPAISGIARLMAERYLPAENNDYLLGLWRADLFHGLLWRGFQTSFTHDTATPRRAGPSWTWATWPIEVFWRRHVREDNSPTTARPEYQQFARVLDCRITEVAPRLQHGKSTPDQPIDRGELTLAGKVATYHPRIDLTSGMIEDPSEVLCSCDQTNRPCHCVHAYFNYPQMLQGLSVMDERPDHVFLQMTPCEILILAAVPTESQDLRASPDSPQRFMRIGILTADSGIDLRWSSEDVTVLVV